MRSVFVVWLQANHLPGWLAPDYMVMVAIAAILGTITSLWLAKRDGANLAIERHALLATYVGALGGGYVFEWLRALPEALLEGSWEPFMRTGRAAYGGLIMGVLAAALVLRREKAPILAFLDRGVPLVGLSFGFVRFGCFLGGCDYGKVTAGSLGVRFPADSPAAIDHAMRGWIPRGAPSLPVHPTQLFEALLGLVAAGIASLWLRRKERDGRAFATWIVLYAIGRFLLEMLRGDGSRGTYGPFSTAQLVSLVLLTAVFVFVAKRPARFTIASAACVLGAMLVPSIAFAQRAPLQVAGSAGDQKIERDRRHGPFEGLHFAVGLLGAGYLVPGRWDISNGGNLALETMFRLPGDDKQHFEVGFEGRYVGSSQANQYGGGVTGRWVDKMDSRTDAEISLTPFYSRISFNSPMFEPVNGFGINMRIGFGYHVVPALTVGFYPLAGSFMGSGDVRLIWSYEPGIWARALVF